jgi:hypothetical protein
VVDQGGGTGQLRREEALMAVAFASIRDPQFLSGAKTNLEHTLWRYGFALSPQEMQEVRRYFDAKGGLDDQAIIDDLEEEQLKRFRELDPSDRQRRRTW